MIKLYSRNNCGLAPNGAEAAKPRYLRSGVYFFFANFTVLDTLCLLHTFEENERCVKIDERKNESR